MKKTTHYISEFPLLQADWNWEKNIGCKPESTASGSPRKIWWKCSVCGFEWEASPNSRTRGSGCPKCGKKKTIKSRWAFRIEKNGGSLATLYPHLLKEWDWNMNEINPNEIPSQCNRKVWWKCSVCGYEWQAIVQSRTKDGCGCPECGKELGKKIKEENKLLRLGSLVDTHPDLIKEWDFETNEISPCNISFKYSKKVHWICIKGHQWQTPVNRRVRLGRGCPICAKEGGTSFAEQAIYYYISSIIPSESRYLHKGIEMDVYIPSLKTGIEYDGLFYHKSQKAIVKEKKKDDTLAKDGIRIIHIKESFEIKLVGDTIYTIYSKDYVYLKDVISNVLLLLAIDVVPDVNIDRDRTRILEHYILNEKANSIVAILPEIAKQWDYQKNGKIKPEFIRSSSNQKFWWKCNKGHSWQAAVYSRANGNGCPCCSGKVLVVGENDLLSQNPKLASEWNYERNGILRPSQITIRNGKKVWWICPICGNEYQSTVAHRSEGKGCPICGRKKSDIGRRKCFLKKNGSFLDVKPQLIEEWDYEKNEGVDPLLVTAHNDKKYWWKCSKCGHSWLAIVSNRVDKGSGCPICKKQLLSKSSSRIGVKKSGSIITTHPYLLADWDFEKNLNIRPEEVSRGSEKPIHWKCHICGYEWIAPVNRRTKSNNKECPKCWIRKGGRWHNK